MDYSLVVVGLVLLALVGFFFLIGGPRFWRDSGRVIHNATTGPGVRELTKSLCTQAAVTDLDELHRLGDQINSKQGPRKTPEVRFNVACFVSEGSKAPSCEEAASLYLHAPSVQPSRVNVVVMIGEGRASSRLHCSKLYSPDGASLGDTPEILD